MGLFDDLTVECALPDGVDPSGLSFQTKDTADQYLTRYILREDGSLLNTETGEVEEHHGALHFYTSNWCGSFMNLYMTTDDCEPWTADYTALYDHGKLLKIEGGKAPVEGVEHVLRADFDRRCAEERARPNRVAVERAEKDA